MRAVAARKILPVAVSSCPLHRGAHWREGGDVFSTADAATGPEGDAGRCGRARRARACRRAVVCRSSKKRAAVKRGTEAHFLADSACKTCQAVQCALRCGPHPNAFENDIGAQRLTRKNTFSVSRKTLESGDGAQPAAGEGARSATRSEACTCGSAGATAGPVLFSCRVATDYSAGQLTTGSMTTATSHCSHATVTEKQSRPRREGP